MRGTRLDFKEIKIDNMFDLITYVTELNADIRKRNKKLPADKHEKELNLSYILKRYEKLRRKEEIDQFREEHECKYCLYFEKPRRCMAVDRCPMDEETVLKKTEEKVGIKCPKYSGDKRCPYSNEAGTCFGFCTRDILEEFKNRNEKELTDGQK